MNATNFQIIPDQSQLDQMQRDLRFYPSPVTDPQVLSREQVAQFNRDGYVSGLRVFDEPQTRLNRQYFDQLLAKVLASGGDSYSISTAHLKYGSVYDLITNPRIVDCVADILGPNLIGWGSHFFCKMPQDGKSVAWHQDASYWPLTPSKTVTVWLAIDDADRQNACMKFIAGSHHVGHLT
ncbi:MAG TPA: phytanoyl-CoA dioxygenase family protein, partial [Planctomycetaceae bacterium]|nr:phytanoyl-CoA dioxygenase family protein [Planctomycetaceae bacterium]